MKSIIFNYLAPILSTMLIGHMCNFPEKVLPMIPSIIGVFNWDKGKNGSSNKDYIPQTPKEPKKVKKPPINQPIKDSDRNKLSYKDYIHSIPKEQKKIWKLSELEYSLREIEKTYANDLEKKEKLTEEILKKAQEIVGTGKMNAEILHKYYEFLDSKDKNSFISRVKGFFNFVNVIWMISIFGIIISFQSSLKILIDKFVEIILFFFESFIYPILVFFKPILLKMIDMFKIFFIILIQKIIIIFEDFIIPIIIKLYIYGVIECLAYVFSIILISDGMKVNKEWGFYISLTGIAFILLLFAYSIELKGERSIGEEEIRLTSIILSILTTIVLFSLSVYFNSKFLSFLATIIFYLFVNSKAVKFGLFNENRSFEDFRIQLVISSFFLINFYIILRWANIDNQIIELYNIPIQIFGTLIYYLGMLIISSKDYCIRMDSYVRRQIIYIASLFLFIFFGIILNLPFLTNITYVFGIVYLIAKGIEITSRIKDGVWLWVFAISIFTWRLSLYLHKHPEIVISLFGGS